MNTCGLEHRIKYFAVGNGIMSSAVSGSISEKDRLALQLLWLPWIGP